MRKRINLTLADYLMVTLIILFAVAEDRVDARVAPELETKKDQIRDLEARLSEERKRLETFNARENGLWDGLRELERQAAGQRLALIQLQQRLVLAKAEAKKMEQRIAGVERVVKEAEIKTSRRLAALYKYYRQGCAKVLADSRGPGQFRQRMKYLDAVVKKDQEMLRNLAEMRVKCREESLEVRKKSAEAQAVITVRETQLLSLKKELEKTVIRLVKVRGERQFYERAVEELQLAADDLRQALASIEKTGANVPVLSTRFKDSKGRLPLPLMGRLLEGDGQPGRKVVGIRKGIFIESTGDTEVKVVFPGRVDFSGRLKGYGETIIINHGSRFFTISARLSGRAKRKGDVVGAGDVIGAVGLAGPSNGHRLYFEIRRAGQNLNPFEWLNIN
jgi:septal ring factor EnvC (AmiA/AmiB activator)